MARAMRNCTLCLAPVPGRTVAMPSDIAFIILKNFEMGAVSCKRGRRTDGILRDLRFARDAGITPTFPRGHLKYLSKMGLRGPVRHELYRLPRQCEECNAFETLMRLERRSVGEQIESIDERVTAFNDLALFRDDRSDYPDRFRRAGPDIYPAMRGLDWR